MLHIERDAVARCQNHDFSTLFVQRQASIGQPCVIGACTSVHAGDLWLMIKDRRTLRWVAAENHRPSPQGSTVAIDSCARTGLTQATVDTGQELTTNHAELVENQEPRPLQVCLKGMKPSARLTGAQWRGLRQWMSP